jgi:RNA polymerase sigma factor (sigma-70 family)
VEARLQESERGRRLRASIAQLCERCQHLFKLRLLEKSTREISALMRAPEATIHVWEHRCRKQLLAELELRGRLV